MKLPSVPLPFYACAASAGFPSPADDLLDGPLDLNRHLIRNPAATFVTRARGHSMRGAGILDGDLLIVDRSLHARDGDIVIATVYGDLTVKRLRRLPNRVRLEAAHPGYAPIDVYDPDDAGLWGVVTYAIHALR